MTRECFGYSWRSAYWRERSGIAIILLMGALAMCTLASYCSLLAGAPASGSGIDMNAGRFKPLLAILPARGTVGYLSDPGVKEENVRDYYLTQYFLAPLVIAPDAARELVVANFASQSAIAPAAAAHGLAVEKDFLNGLALLRRPLP